MKLLAVAPPHLWMFCVLMLGTASRPDAIRELTRGQCDFENRLIYLNAQARAANYDQLGHKQREFSTTEIYAPFDPSYLEASKRAIDGYFELLRVNYV